MILNTLTLRDIGVYADEQRLEFAPASRDRPVTLIGGLNGAGKTTLMRALFHVLYGAHALPLIERRGGYDRYLQDTVRSGAESASIELAFELQRNAKDEQITIRRSWKRRRDRFIETVEAFRDGSYDSALSEGWFDFIESIVPRGIARLVFFDGEKVEALADLENASETLKTAVGSLLGLDLVDQLVVDLEVVERRRAIASASPEEQARSQELDGKVAEAQEQLAHHEQELEAFKLEVQEAAAALVTAEDAFRTAGGDFFERRTSLVAELEQARESLRAAEMDGRALAVQELVPLLLIRDAVGALDTAARQEQDADELRATRRIVGARDEFFDSLLREFDVAAEVRRKLEKRLKDDRAQLQADIEERPPGLGLAPSAPLLSNLASGALASVDAQRLGAIASIEEEQERLDHVERLTTQIPTEDAVRELDHLRSEAADRLATLRARADACASACDDAQRSVVRAKTERERHAKELANAGLHRLDSERLVKHAEKARQTLTKLRERAAARHLARIAELAVEALEQLLRKERLIAQIEIDPLTYAPSFCDHRGGQVHPEQLSAGERQLTALALLWALARASGRPLPVLIDTPLGRLDAGHRRHVVSRYLPMASQQVIVLSTDTEIEDSLLHHLEPHIGARYELVFDTENEATSIAAGYLDLDVAA